MVTSNKIIGLLFIFVFKYGQSIQQLNPHYYELTLTFLPVQAADAAVLVKEYSSSYSLTQSHLVVSKDGQLTNLQLGPADLNVTKYIDNDNQLQLRKSYLTFVSYSDVYVFIRIHDKSYLRQYLSRYLLKSHNTLNVEPFTLYSLMMDQLVNKGKSEVSPLSNDNTGNSNKFIGQVKFVTFHSGDWLEIYTDFHVKPSLFTLDNKKLISKNVRTIPPSRNGTKYTAYIITIPVPGVHAFYSPAPYLAYVVGRQGNRIEGGMVEDKIKY